MSFLSKVNPSNRIWTSDLWISVLLIDSTVHRSTNWAIEGIYFTCLKVFKLSSQSHCIRRLDIRYILWQTYQTKSSNSRVAQWKRAGPITQRSVDRNYALLYILIIVNKSGWRRCVQVAVHFCGRGFESHFWQIFFTYHSKNLQSEIPETYRFSPISAEDSALDF